MKNRLFLFLLAQELPMAFSHWSLKAHQEAECWKFFSKYRPAAAQRACQHSTDIPIDQGMVQNPHLQTHYCRVFWHFPVAAEQLNYQVLLPASYLDLERNGRMI